MTYKCVAQVCQRQLSLLLTLSLESPAIFAQNASSFQNSRDRSKIKNELDQLSEVCSVGLFKTDLVGSDPMILIDGKFLKF